MARRGWDVNEFELIARYFERAAAGRPDIVLAVGDDCALWQPDGTVAVATDMLVGGRHFFDDVDPRALGHKALAVNL
ncbi:MAG: thiamine-phosphate kinase, partial [Burkholderiales bacterium]